MLTTAKTLCNYILESLDGEIGRSDDLLFDDRYWAIRYLVAHTGTWLPEKKVLLSPYSIVPHHERENRAQCSLAINLTKKQIEASPALGRDEPVTRQFETSFHGYYGSPHYWDGEPAREEVAYALRSADEISRHHIQATDGNLGHVSDLIVDDDTWMIRYLVVDTRNWWPGKKVLISPRWAKRIDWQEQIVHLDHSREAVEASPEYTEEALITRQYETALHSHYHSSGYWTEETAIKHPSR